MPARVLRILIVLLASLGTLYTGFAQIPGEDWTRIALLGLNTRAVAVSPRYSQGDGTLWAGTQGAGVWYSNDYGATWAQSTGSNGFETKTVTDLAVSPDLEPSSLYIVCNARAQTRRARGKMPARVFRILVVLLASSGNVVYGLCPNSRRRLDAHRRSLGINTHAVARKSAI